MSIDMFSVTKSCLTLCNPMGSSMPGFPAPQYIPEFAQIHVHWVGDAVQTTHTLSPSSPVLNLSQHQGLLQWVHSSYRVGRVLELSFSDSPSNEYSGLISFRIDWFDPLAIQGSLKNLLRHHSLKVSVIWSSGFFTDQLSRTGKTIALTYMDLCWQSDVSAF